MKQALKRIAGSQWQYLRVTRQLLRAFAAGYGQYDRECPLCRHQGRFLAEVLDWRFFHDYFHNNVIYKGFNGIGNILRNPVDLGLIDGIVNGVGQLVKLFSGRTRRIQTGYVRTYAIALLFGVVVVIFLMIAPLLMNGSGS